VIINVAILNGDRGTLEGLATLIRATPGLHLGSACRSGNTALAELSVSLPQIIVVEPNLTDVPAFRLLLQLRALLPAVRVVVLDRELNAHTVQLAIAAGAHALLPVESPAVRLLEAIFQVASGGAWLDPVAVRFLVERLHLEPSTLAAVMNLTRREVEVLEGYSRGHRGKEVADWLHLSPFTVQTHVRNIYSKLDARSMAHAIARYHPLGRFSIRCLDQKSEEGSEGSKPPNDPSAGEAESGG